MNVGKIAYEQIVLNDKDALENDRPAVMTNQAGQEPVNKIEAEIIPKKENIADIILKKVMEQNKLRENTGKILFLLLLRNKMKPVQWLKRVIV